MPASTMCCNLLQAGDENKPTRFRIGLERSNESVKQTRSNYTV